jgi:hypothetical protein
MNFFLAQSKHCQVQNNRIFVFFLCSSEYVNGRLPKKTLTQLAISKSIEECEIDLSQFDLSDSDIKIIGKECSKQKMKFVIKD